MSFKICELPGFEKVKLGLFNAGLRRCNTSTMGNKLLMAVLTWWLERLTRLLYNLVE